MNEQNTAQVVSQENKPKVVTMSWDDYEAEPIKLCKLEDPTCEACQ